MVEITWEEQGLVRRLSGVITTEELDSSAIQIQVSPRLDEMTYNIHDFTGVTEARVDPDYIEFMATRAAIALRRNPEIRLAFVGDHPILDAMMDAFNACRLAKQQVMRFDSIEEARRYVASARGR